MRKRNLQKAVVLVICFAFLGLSASGLSAAPQKSTKVSFALLFSNPAQFLVSVFPGLRSILNVEQPTQTDSMKTVKTTGTIKSIRLSTKD